MIKEKINFKNEEMLKYIIRKKHMIQVLKFSLINVITRHVGRYT